MNGFSPGRRAASAGGANRAVSEDQNPWLTAAPIPRSRPERLRLAALWLEDLVAEERGNTANEAFREHRCTYDPRLLGGTPKPYSPPEIPQGEVNVSDPDSRRMMGNRRYIQGDHAQAVVNEQQIVNAAEITADAGDFSHLRPMLTAALSELEKRAGINHTPTVAVADAQSWNEQHMDDVISEHGTQALISRIPAHARENGQAGPARTGQTREPAMLKPRSAAVDYAARAAPRPRGRDERWCRPHPTGES